MDLVISDQDRDCLLSLCSTGSVNEKSTEMTDSGTEHIHTCSLSSDFSNNEPSQVSESDPGCESLVDELLQWCNSCEDDDSHFTQGMFLNSCNMKESSLCNNDNYFDQLLNFGENTNVYQENETPIFSKGDGFEDRECLINCELDLLDCGVLEELMDVKSASPLTCVSGLEKYSENVKNNPREHSDCVCSCLVSSYPNFGKRVIPSHRCSLKKNSILSDTENSLCVPEVLRGCPEDFYPTQRQYNFNSPKELLHDCPPSLRPMFSLSLPISPVSVYPSSVKSALALKYSTQSDEMPLPFHLLLEQNQLNSTINFTEETLVNERSSGSCSWKQTLNVKNSCVHTDNDESCESKTKARHISVLARHSEVQNMLKERSRGKTYASSLLGSKNTSQYAKELCKKPNTSKERTEVVPKNGKIGITLSIINTYLKKNIIWNVGKRDKLIKVSSKDMRRYAVRDLLKISGNWEYKTMKEETRELRQDRGLLLQKKKERLDKMGHLESIIE